MRDVRRRGRNECDGCKKGENSIALVQRKRKRWPKVLVLT